MKIRMLTTAAGPTGNYSAGQEYISPFMIPDELAKQFVKGRAAVEVKEEKLEAGKVETAAAAPQAERANDKSKEVHKEKEERPAARSKSR